MKKKYTTEFKLKVVSYYLENDCGYKTTAKHFDIPGFCMVYRWVKHYEKHGVAGIIGSDSGVEYDGEFKVAVIEYMHSNHLSHSKTAIEYNLSGADIVERWERIYLEKGVKGLIGEKREQREIMKKQIKQDINSKYTDEELLAEVKRLRMENAYLKKLRALVQERTKPANGKK